MTSEELDEVWARMLARGLYADTPWEELSEYTKCRCVLTARTVRLVGERAGLARKEEDK